MDKEGRTIMNDVKALTFDEELTGYMKEIAVQLWYQWQAAPFRLLLVTSSLKNEGKTFVASHLARALAFNFNNVLLISHIDGRSHSGIKTADDEININREGSVIPGISPGCVSTLTLFSEDRPENNKWLLGNFEKLAGEVEKQFDITLLDFPSLVDGNFPFFILPRIDKILLVVRANYAPKKFVLDSLKLLGNYQDKLGGFVLNKRREYIPKIFLSRFYR